MKGRSSLNPHVPLSKRNAEKDSKNHDESHPQPQHNQHLLQSKTKNMPQSLQVKNVTELEVHQADLELGYLKSAFPDYAEQSLRDAYLANNSDLDYSIDLLHHFDDDEINGDKSSVRHWILGMFQNLYQQLKLVLRQIWHKFKSE